MTMAKKSKTNSKAKAKPKRLPSHAQLPPTPSPTLHRELAAQLATKPNIVGTYLGLKRKRGKYLREPSLVVVVHSKIDEDELEDHEVILPEVELAVSPRAKLRLRTDVVVAEIYRRAAVASPGDATSPHPGTIGSALAHPVYGPVVSTAGHVYSSVFPISSEWSAADAPSVTARDRETGAIMPGQLRRLLVTSVADYALIVPTTVIARNVYDDRLLGGPYQPQTSDLDEPCFVLKNGSEHETAFRGLDSSIQFDDGSRIDHAILTDRCTQGGDSGCCLVDASRRIVGLLVGHSASHSAFMPIHRMLANEQASLL